MTLLSLVQQQCQLRTLAVPLTVVGSTDTTIKQMFALVNELVEAVIDQSKFQAYIYEALFTLLPQEDQGSLYDIAGNGYLWANNATFFDRTLRRPLYGPMNDVQWQEIKALPNPGPWYKYRIRQDHLLINPAPTDPFSLIAFEYGSSYGVAAIDGTAKPYFTADTDTWVLPERILSRGLSYRWKQEKGLPYQEDQDRFYSMLNNQIARDGTKRSYDLAGSCNFQLSPGIFVPSGNWPVS